MRPRVWLARTIIKAAGALRSSALLVMRPDDLIAFGREKYAAPENVEGWCNEQSVMRGLNEHEEKLLAAMPSPGRRLLLLGLGGGRDAIDLARRGFEVTGVDYLPVYAERTRQNAAKAGVEVRTLVQEISRLDVPDGSVDVVWISVFGYSMIPTQARRVAMLRRLARALSPGGFVACQFMWDAQASRPPRVSRARRAVAWLTLGFTSLESGDQLWGEGEFMHLVRTIEEVRSEAEAGGFQLFSSVSLPTAVHGGAVLRKAGRPGPPPSPAA